MGKLTNAELETLLNDTTKRAEGAEARITTLTVDLEKATDQATTEAKARQAAEKQVDDLNEELRQTKASLRAYKGSATRAVREATILKREQSPQARPIGAMKSAKTDEEKADRAEALELAFTTGPTEIVFSDGKREIREIAPLLTDANAWYQTPHHRELAADPILEPVGGNRAEVELAGFALLNEAGDQVGYCELPQPIVIGRGQHMRIPRGSIRF